ncbi:MAG TPA: hypothetical protein VHE55_09660 [Fimbriimonadaceae bacterium]|nr:hypothetical protein [Fimbriimonadaceae bacterium]
MKSLLVLFVALIAAFAMAQKHYVPGHFTKKGKWVEGKWVKDRNIPSSHTGQHREHRFYEGHYAKDGHWIKPHWRWVWVKDK